MERLGPDKCIFCMENDRGGREMDHANGRTGLFFEHECIDMTVALNEPLEIQIEARKCRDQAWKLWDELTQTHNESDTLDLITLELGRRRSTIRSYMIQRGHTFKRTASTVHQAINESKRAAITKEYKSKLVSLGQAEAIKSTAIDHSIGPDAVRVALKKSGIKLKKSYSGGLMGKEFVVRP